LKKIGEGAINLVLKTLSNTDGNYYVLIINKNSDCLDDIESPKGSILISNMQENGDLNNNIVQVYGNFIIKNVSLTNDKNYCPKVKNMDLVIQIEEYIDGITLDEKVFEISKDYSKDKVKFLLELNRKMQELLQYIKVKGLYYYDLNTTNLMLRDPNDLNTLTFIDVDSFETRIDGKQLLETDDDGLDSQVKRNLSLDMYGSILDPMTPEEMQENNYKSYRDKF